MGLLDEIALFVFPPGACEFLVLLIDGQVNVSKVSLHLVRKEKSGRSSSNAYQLDMPFRVNGRVGTSLEIGHGL